MKFKWTLCVAAALCWPSGHAAWGQAPGNNEQGVEVLTRGAVHEAFAEPVGLNPEPGEAIAKAPPEPIEELPPEARPDDPNAVWIGGYWNWDADRSDFVWISGVWRIAPDGQRWVPGYWTESPQGHRRVSGFWASLDAQQVTYLPPPPASVENGPNGDAPSANHFWTPGCWLHNGSRYQWRAGFWALNQADWVWTAAHYCWTPLGVVFIDGYWDCPFDQRGVLFSPVYFQQPIYTQPGYVFSPSVFIAPQFLGQHLFFGPSRRQYYFGDYYAQQYGAAGFQPWFAIGGGANYFYDPIYSYRSWQFGRNNPAWVNGYRQRYDALVQNENGRPPHTFNAINAPTAAGAVVGGVAGTQVAFALSDALKNNRSDLRFAKLNDDQRRELQDNQKQDRQWIRQRADKEAGGLKAGGARGENNQASAPLPLPPLGDRRNIDQVGVVPPGTASSRTDNPVAGRPGADRPNADNPGRRKIDGGGLVPPADGNPLANDPNAGRPNNSPRNPNAVGQPAGPRKIDDGGLVPPGAGNPRANDPNAGRPNNSPRDPGAPGQTPGKRKIDDGGLVPPGAGNPRAADPNAGSPAPRGGDRRGPAPPSPQPIDASGKPGRVARPIGPAPGVGPGGLQPLAPATIGNDGRAIPNRGNTPPNPGAAGRGPKNPSKSPAMNPQPAPNNALPNLPRGPNPLQPNGPVPGTPNNGRPNPQGAKGNPNNPPSAAPGARNPVGPPAGAAPAAQPGPKAPNPQPSPPPAGPAAPKGPPPGGKKP